MNILEGSSASAVIKERPIIFSAPMVRAIIEGRKTQTRRVFSLEEISSDCVSFNVTSRQRWVQQFEYKGVLHSKAWSHRCPYGVPGDRLWVRENLRRPDGDPWCYSVDSQPVMVDKSDETAMLVWAHHKEQDYCTSIHMPRWASRITLELTDVRVQRVQEISEDDARAEGVSAEPVYCERHPRLTCAYAVLWDEINGKRPGCAWDDNPWVWALTFRRVSS